MRFRVPAAKSPRWTADRVDTKRVSRLFGEGHLRGFLLRTPASKETLGRFGRPGRQIGQFTALHNIAVDRQGNVNTGQREQKFRRVDLQN